MSLSAVRLLGLGAVQLNDSSYKSYKKHGERLKEIIEKNFILVCRDDGVNVA